MCSPWHRLSLLGDGSAKGCPCPWQSQEGLSSSSWSSGGAPSPPPSAASLAGSWRSQKSLLAFWREPQRVLVWGCSEHTWSLSWWKKGEFPAQKKKKLKKHFQPGSSLLPWGLWGSPHRELCPLSWIVLGAWASAWSGEGLGMLFLMSFPSISAVPCSAFPSLCSSKVRIPRANPRKEKSPFFPPSLSSEQRRAGIVPRA